MDKKVSNTVLISFPLLYFMLSCVLTAQKYRSIFSVSLALMCGLIAYLVFSINTNSINIRNELSVVLLSVIQIAIIGISTLFISNSLYLEETKGYLKGLLVLSISWLAYIVLREIDKKSLKILVRIYLFAIVLFSAFTLYVEFTGPENVIRYTAMGIFYDAGVIYGGYDFIYSIVVVYCALFFYFISNQKKLSIESRIIILVALVIIFLTVAFSNYSTAILLVVFFSVSPFLAKVKNKVSLAFVLLVGFIVFLIFSKPIAEIVRGLPLPELTTTRISNLILSLTGQEGVENPIFGEGQRLDRMLWSLRIVAENPIVGGFVGNTSQAFGYHTEWIEKAAKHGLVYMFFHACFWINAARKLVGFCESIEEKNLVKTVFIIFIILGFTNPITLITTPAPLFLLCPFLKTAFPTLNRKE